MVKPGNHLRFVTPSSWMTCMCVMFKRGCVELVGLVNPLRRVAQMVPKSSIVSGGFTLLMARTGPWVGICTFPGPQITRSACNSPMISTDPKEISAREGTYHPCLLRSSIPGSVGSGAPHILFAFK